VVQIKCEVEQCLVSHWMKLLYRIARRASGLEAEDTKVNVSLNLVNQRIIAMRQASE
jgi:hypothetical protein